MLIELPVVCIIFANISGWLAMHLLVAWAGTRLPADCFNERRFPFRSRKWESGGRLYESVFRIRVWKDLLPDGAAWFRGGFPKAVLRSRKRAYLARFVKETCRGEAVHWMVMAASPLFFIWNPPGVGAIMIAYGVMVNLPCILIQRYNRNRLLRLCGPDGTIGNAATRPPF